MNSKVKQASSAYVAKIAGNIQQVRLEKGFTQTYIGAKLGISQNAYSKIELNQTRLTVEHLLLLCEIFDTSIESLLLKNPSRSDEAV